MEQSVILKQALGLLKIVGANPLTYGKGSLVLNIVIILHEFIAAVLMIMTILGNLDDMNVIGETLTGLVGVYQAMAKYIVILVHKKNIRQMIVSLENFWNIDIFGPNCEGPVRRGHAFVTTACRVLFATLAATFIVYCLKPLLIWERVLPVEWYDFCNLTRHSCFAVHYIMQIFSTTSMYFIISGFDGVLFSLLSMAYCELEKIKYGLINLNIDESSKLGDDRDVLDKIRILVKQHNHVLEFIANTNIIYSNVLMNQMASSVGAICVGIYTLMIEGLNQDVSLIAKHVFYILTVSAQIFTYCFAGQHITEQAESVADMAYQCQWHFTYHPKLTNSLCMIMCRAQKETKIVAGGMWTLELNAFTKVMQTGFSLVTLMQTIQQPI